MVQIIAIKVEVSNAKRKRKALKLAAAAQGVESVALNGEDGVIVTGDEVDAVCLINSMRKKFGYAKLLSLQHESPSEGGGSSDGGGGGEEETSPCCPCNCNNCCQFPPPPYPITYMIDSDPYPTICSIM
ncbi:hypothetical protein QN277_004574 [Acacia crassicarpa]|uniref:Uncharacterized protein n=1 Tax=Acacia crassicarpa TaxID=499986 RepID=A0AAE1J250_9FABA|nr:hypothetical protein QN277_004574 [Acacia crassicarpa]